MKISDALVGAGFAGAGALVFAGTLTYPPMEGGQPGPALFPRIIAVLLIGFGARLGWEGVRSRDRTEAVAWRDLHRNPAFVNALFVVAAVVGYVALADHLGFLLTTAGLMFGLMWRLAVRPPTAAAVAVAFTLVVHVLFAKLLRVPLPAGLLWW
jgi:putative tricarboxylic transport membrane protein